MVAVPTVRTFLGCVDLRVACLVIAAIRLVISVVALVALLLVFLITEDAAVEASNEAKEDDKTAYGFLEFMIAVYSAILAVVLITNLLVTYWFIQGVTSNKPQKMKYYLWLEQVLIVLLVFAFVYRLYRVDFLIEALAESYVYICSNSLYQECLLGQYNENAENATENTVMKFDNVPPPDPVYSTYDEQTQPAQNSNPFKE
ncbi:uncharacterized protein LOC119077432 [Bradysia coprophila]|uniref:uncharacterized protein LOC119077432 n=1 Tax=Bradysia coprophila TaxID=38358 RepID=UPI00187D7C1D|nr:uncharacterized protein LOC119077432 [Bradysia coprophila]